jgi:hypothetical protein
VPELIATIDVKIRQRRDANPGALRAETAAEPEKFSPAVIMADHDKQKMRPTELDLA